MIGNITKGTKEYIRVVVVDRSNTITDLSASSPTFKVLDSADTVKQGPTASATASGMIISCLVDTNTGGAWAEGDFRLFVTFTVGSEVVSKGPFPFGVIE